MVVDRALVTKMEWETLPVVGRNNDDDLYTESLLVSTGGLTD